MCICVFIEPESVSDWTPCKYYRDNGIHPDHTYRILPIIGASPNRGAPHKLGDSVLF